MSCEEFVKLLSGDGLDLLVSIATIVMAIIAIFVAIWQLNVGRTETRSAQAHETYQQYLARCVEYPELAEGYIALSNPDPKYGQYKWFVASMLFSFEQILEAKPKDMDWVTAIRSQLRIHKVHLKGSDSVKRGEWHSSLQKLLNEILEETQE